MVKHRTIPDRWLDYTPIGKRIEGTRFIAFKVPLRKHVCDNLNDDRTELHPDKLLDYIPNLGLIIDLTNTTKYYDSDFFTKNGVKYVKIACPGKQLPERNLRDKFNQLVKRYLDENRDNGKLIGVHCTHGVNRTGFLICSFMVTELKMDPLLAIANFEMARGHSIERVNYRNMIMSLKMLSTKIRKESRRSRSSDSNDDDYYNDRKKRRLSKESSSRSPVKSIDWKRIPKNSEEKRSSVRRLSRESYTRRSSDRNINSSVRRLSRESYTRRSSDRNINWKRVRKDSDGKNSSVPSEPRWVPMDRNRNPKESSINNGYYNNRHDNEFSYDNRAKRPKVFHREYQNNFKYNKGDNSRRMDWKNNRFSFNKTKNASFNARGVSSRYVYIRKESKGNESLERRGENQGRWQRNQEESGRDRERKDEYQGRHERNLEDSSRDYGRKDNYRGKQERSLENLSRGWERRDENQERWEKNTEEFGRKKRVEYQGKYEKNFEDSSRNYGRRDDYQGRQEKSLDNSTRNWERRDGNQGRWGKNFEDSSRDYEKRREGHEKKDEYREKQEGNERRYEYQGRQEDPSKNREGRDEYQRTDDYGTYKINRSNPFKTKAKLEEDDRNYLERYERDSRRDEWEKKDFKPPHPRELPLPRWKSERNDRDSSRQNYHHMKPRAEDERRSTREIGKSFAAVVKLQPRWVATHVGDGKRN